MEKTSTSLDGELSIQEIAAFKENGLIARQAFVADNGICSLWTDVTATGKVFINIKYHKEVKFSLSVYKKMLLDFENVLDVFRNKGVETLYSLVPGHEDPYTFGTMFGFVPIQTINNPHDGSVYMWVLIRKL